MNPDDETITEVMLTRFAMQDAWVAYQKAVDAHYRAIRAHDAKWRDSDVDLAGD